MSNDNEEWNNILVEKVKDTLFAITSPRYWTKLHPFSEEWNTILKDLMKRHNFRVLDGYTARLGDRTIWFRNHPYGSFTNQYDCMERTVEGTKNKLIEVSVRMSKMVQPSRRTIHNAMKKLINDCICDSGLDKSALQYLLKCRDMYKSVYY